MLRYSEDRVQGRVARVQEEQRTWVFPVHYLAPGPGTPGPYFSGGKMLLAIDIGNTNVVLGVFNGEQLVENWRVGTNTQITPDEYAMIFKDLFGFAGIGFDRIQGVIISSVVPPLLSVMVEMSRKYFKIEPIVVTHELKTGITIRTDNPKEMGADRVVNAAAAYKFYGGPLIIVDFGTATTFCAITKKGEYLGGAICPGVNI